MRRVIVALFTAGLALGVVLLWPDATADDPPTTEAVATTSTTTTPLTTTTSVLDRTSTSEAPDDSHVVTTVEEAEEILREHYFGWFHGIYNQDEGAIRLLVILPDQAQAAIDQFGIMEFTAEPKRDGVVISDLEILRADSECLAVFASISAGFRDGATSGVVVFRWIDEEWRFLSSWSSLNDLWEPDCTSLL